jgi:hypothetical protein
VSKLLSTADVKANERMAYWVDAVCDTYVQLDCEAAGDRRSIDGEIRLDRLATLELSRVSASAQRVRRTPAKIARASEDYFLVSIQTAGRGAVIQDGRHASLGPGDFALYDSTRPYELQFDAGFQQYVLMLPGPTLRSQLPDTDRLTARPVSGRRGAGHLMIGMIRSLARDIATLEPASAAAVAQSVEHILVAGLRALPGAPGPSALFPKNGGRSAKILTVAMRTPFPISIHTKDFRVFSGKPSWVSGTRCRQNGLDTIRVQLIHQVV